MRKMTVIILALVLVFALASFVMAEVNNQNANEEVNISSDNSQYRDNADCDGEELRLREQRHEFRNLQQQAGENGEYRQERKQLRRNRFAYEG